MTKPAAHNGANEIEAPSLLKWLRRTSFSDIVNSETHSKDFNGSRAEYISMRVRLLALVFAILSLLWIPVDAIVVSDDVFSDILNLRLIYCALFLCLGVIASGSQNLLAARLRLLFFVLIPCAFYIFSRQIFTNSEATQGIMIGYSFLPYLTVVLLAIFPLTLIEGFSYATLIGITFLGSEIYFNGALSISSASEVWLLTLLAGIAIWAQLTQLHMLLRLYREASRDPLTGLVNRRVLNKWLGLEISRSRQQGRPLSILLFDLDFFKKINDTYGHLIGDRVLQRFSRLLKTRLEKYNLIGRYGGEEFIAVLPSEDAVAAMAIAEAIRIDCHSLLTSGPKGTTVGFTVSIGVTELLDSDTIESLINRVDKGLYDAKMQGRDTVMLVREEPD